MGKKKRVSIERAVNMVIREYNKAKDSKFVQKPISYALHETWKHFDAIEEKRSNNEHSD